MRTTLSSLDPHQSAGEDAISPALHWSLPHLENNNTYIRMLFVDFSSAFNSFPVKIIRKNDIFRLQTVWIGSHTPTTLMLDATPTHCLWLIILQVFGVERVQNGPNWWTYTYWLTLLSNGEDSLISHWRIVVTLQQLKCAFYSMGQTNQVNLMSHLGFQVIGCSPVHV